MAIIKDNMWTISAIAHAYGVYQDTAARMFESDLIGGKAHDTDRVMTDDWYAEHQGVWAAMSEEEKSAERTLVDKIFRQKTQALYEARVAKNRPLFEQIVNQPLFESNN